MALQGNPFLGKLKIPAPDLSRIPETPFESKAPKRSEPPLSPAALPAEVAPKADRVQTGSELGSNRVQTGSELGSNRVQKRERKTSSAELNPIAPVPVRVQTGSETGSNSAPKLPAYGELAVLRYFADREPSPGEVVSTRRREIAISTVQTLNGVKTALRRLREARLIELHDFSRGPNRGITSYRLTPTARELLGSKSAIERLGFNRVQTGSETGSNGFSSSSSSLKVEDLKTTTTSAPELFDESRLQLAPEWKSVDIACVSTIGFTRHQLVQIVRASALSPEEVRDSLAYFAFAYERGDLKKIRDPLGYLMSILRKPSTFPRPEGYETPLESSRRKYLETKRRIEAQRQAEERELQDLEFAEWRRGVGPDEVNAIVPEVVRHAPKACESSLRAYFDESVWPSMRAAIPGAREHERAEIARQVEQSLGEVVG